MSKKILVTVKRTTVEYQTVEYSNEIGCDIPEDMTEFVNYCIDVKENPETDGDEWAFGEQTDEVIDFKVEEC